MLSSKDFIDNKYLVDNFYSFIALTNLHIFRLLNFLLYLLLSSSLRFTNNSIKRDASFYRITQYFKLVFITRIRKNEFLANLLIR